MHGWAAKLAAIVPAHACSLESSLGPSCHPAHTPSYSHAIVHRAILLTRLRDHPSPHPLLPLHTSPSPLSFTPLCHTSPSPLFTRVLAGLVCHDSSRATVDGCFVRGNEGIGVMAAQHSKVNLRDTPCVGNGAALPAGHGEGPTVEAADARFQIRKDPEAELSVMRTVPGPGSSRTHSPTADGAEPPPPLPADELLLAAAARAVEKTGRAQRAAPMARWPAGVARAEEEAAERAGSAGGRRPPRTV